MSEEDKDSAYLNELKQAAEAQMRRPAPPIQQAAKKQKRLDHKNTADVAVDETAEDAAVERVSRYSYAAVDAIMKGCSGFLGMCDFKRSNSATKEMTDILRKVLPGDRKLQLVKVGCDGLVVIVIGTTQQQQQPVGQRHQSADPVSDDHHQQQQQQQESEPEVQPIAVVDEILSRSAEGSIKKTRFCQRIAPIETTCPMAAALLKAAVTKVVNNYLAKRHGTSSSSGGDAQHSPIQFAVLFKNRDTNTPSAKIAPKAATNQQQQQHDGSAAAAAAVVQSVPDSERLDKSKAINIAVAVMQDCCESMGGAQVNLRLPDVVLMLEVLPLTGQQQACAVSALPGRLMLTRPKLCIRPVAAGGGSGVSKQLPQVKLSSTSRHKSELPRSPQI